MRLECAKSSLEEKSAQENLILTEAQLAALEKGRQEKEAHGEIETKHPGYSGAQDTFYLGTLKGVGRIYQQRLSYLKCHVSMSRVANCYDNAAMESSYSTFKLDCASAQFPSRTLACSAIFEYIEAWYNRKCLHSSLGYLSPEEFESLPSSDILSVH